MAYHGGELNGISFRRIMTHLKEIFAHIYNHFLNYNHAERCADDEAFQTCQLYSDIYGVLDVITSKIWLKFGDLCEKDL